MSNFVWDGTATPTDKIDSASIPTGANTANYIRAIDVNTLYQFLREIRDAVWKGGGVLTPASSPPGSGTHDIGDLLFNSAPAELGNLGWVCLTAGTPGQWRKFGLIADSGGDLQPGLTAHLADTTDAHAGTAITNTPSGNLAATTVQGALNELQSDVDTRATSAALTAHTGASSGAHAASAISNTPSGNLSSTDVQAALNELQTDINGISGGFPERKGAGTAAPVAGTYAVGDLWINTAPAVGGNWGWVCVTAGTPGTWREVGAVAVDVINGDASQAASTITFTPNGSIAATNVQTAIQEVRDEAAPVALGFTTSGTAAPASGTWAVGDTCKNTAPADGEAAFWICTAAGTPGTWRACAPVTQQSAANPFIYGSTTWNPASIASGAGTGITFAVSGVQLGDQVIGISHSQIGVVGMYMSGVVSSAGNVDVTLINASGSTQDVASGTLRVTVLKVV